MMHRSVHPAEDEFPQRRPASRGRLLDAGHKLVSGDATQLVRRGLTVEQVCTAAGLARRTFYGHFDTLDEYVDALRETMRSEIESERAPTALDLRSFDGDLRSLVKQAVVDGAADRRSKRDLLIGLRVLGAETNIEEHSSPWFGLIEQMERLGFRPPPTSSARDVVEPLEVLLDGAADSIAEGREWETAEPWCRAIEHVLLQLSDSQGDDEPLPVDARRSRLKACWTESVSDISTPNLRGVVVGVAEEMLTSTGAHTVSVGAVSARTGFSRAAIARHVGNSAGILAAVVDEVVPGLHMLLQRDVAGGAPPREALSLHLHRVVRAVRERPAFGAALQAVAEREQMAIEPLSIARLDLNRLVASVLNGVRGTENSWPQALVVERLVCQVPRVLVDADVGACCEVIGRCISS